MQNLQTKSPHRWSDPRDTLGSMMTLHTLETVLPLGFQLFIFALIGLCFGSFSTMLLYRLPTGKPIGGRSGCTSCNHQLSWFELFPLVSYIALRGKCRACHAHISLRYPFVEALCSILFLFIALAFRSLPILLLFPLSIACFIAFLIALYDSQTQRIPDVLTGALAIAAILYQLGITIATDKEMVWGSIYGAAMIGTLFGAMWLVSRGRWIGSGDIFLGSALGLLLSFQQGILMLFSAYAIGAVVSLVLLCTQKISRDTHIAFAPFLVLGTFVALFVGDKIVAWYVSLLI